MNIHRGLQVQFEILMQRKIENSTLFMSFFFTRYEKLVL